MNTEIAAKIAEMDGVISDKTQAIDDVLANLTENFLEVFWTTLSETYEYVQYYERKAIVHKALAKKDAFVDAIQGLRNMLVDSLAETRTTLVGELGSERDMMASWITEQRNAFAA